MVGWDALIITFGVIYERCLERVTDRQNNMRVQYALLNESGYVICLCSRCELRKEK